MASSFQRHTKTSEMTYRSVPGPEAPCLRGEDAVVMDRYFIEYMKVFRLSTKELHREGMEKPEQWAVGSRQSAVKKECGRFLQLFL